MISSEYLTELMNAPNIKDTFGFGIGSPTAQRLSEMAAELLMHRENAGKLEFNGYTFDVRRDQSVLWITQDGGEAMAMSGDQFAKWWKENF